LLLWLALVGALPLPILLLGPGHVPAASLVELGAIGLAIALVESARGTVLPVAGIFLGQGLLYAALLWLAAGWVRRVPRVGAALALALAAGLVAAAALLPLYHTPYHASRARVGLLELYP
jgi:hypothetical protein